MNKDDKSKEIKRRWKKYDGVGVDILNIVKKNKNITTSGVIKKLKDSNISVTWKLVNSYLVEFQESKKVKRIQIGDKHKINFWNLA